MVVHRLPRGESLVTPASRCPSCETPIAPWDNIPVLSWLLLRGRCRHCGAPISPRYPAIEAFVAVAFVVVALVRGVDDDLVVELPFVAMLVAVAAIDLERQIIPNRIVVPTAVFGLAASAVVKTDDLPELLIAGAGAFLFMFVVVLMWPGGMGMGDVKLAGVMGLYLGVAVIPALFIGFAAGALVGVAVMAREGAGARKKRLPFGPFLALGGFLALLVGQELVDVYADNFL